MEQQSLELRTAQVEATRAIGHFIMAVCFQSTAIGIYLILMGAVTTAVGRSNVEAALWFLIIPGTVKWIQGFVATHRSKINYENGAGY